MIHKQHAIEMIDFVLNAGRKKPVHFLFAGFVLVVELPDRHLLGPLHFGEILR